MNDSKPAPAKGVEWEAMSDQQKIEWLATKVMGWKKDRRKYRNGHWLDHDNPYADGPVWWNPLTDWNHTMEVVEKMRTAHSAKLHFIHGTDTVPDLPMYCIAHFSHNRTSESLGDSVDGRNGQEAICKAAFLVLQ